MDAKEPNAIKKTPKMVIPILFFFMDPLRSRETKPHIITAG